MTLEVPSGYVTDSFGQPWSIIWTYSDANGVPDYFKVEYDAGLLETIDVDQYSQWDWSYIKYGYDPYTFQSYTYTLYDNGTSTLF